MSATHLLSHATSLRRFLLAFSRITPGLSRNANRHWVGKCHWQRDFPSTSKLGSLRLTGRHPRGYVRAGWTKTFTQNHCNPSFTRQTIARTMTTSRDTVLQSDITKMKTEKDGSFKRADASFRNIIEKGGKFEPESGMEGFPWYLA